MRIAACFILLTVLFSHSSCYSLRGTSISPNISTFRVEPFRDNTLTSPPTLAQNTTEALRDKIRTESRLTQTDQNPDIEFKGSIADYRISSEAPRPGELTALNRLTIVLAVEYINYKDEEEGWKSNFSFFFDFPSGTDFASVEEEATSTITEQLMEDIFNRAFTSW